MDLPSPHLYRIARVNPSATDILVESVRSPYYTAYRAKRLFQTESAGLWKLSLIIKDAILSLIRDEIAHGFGAEYQFSRYQERTMFITKLRVFRDAPSIKLFLFCHHGQDKGTGILSLLDVMLQSYQPAEQGQFVLIHVLPDRVERSCFEFSRDLEEFCYRRAALFHQTFADGEEIPDVIATCFPFIEDMLAKEADRSQEEVEKMLITIQGPSRL